MGRRQALIAATLAALAAPARGDDIKATVPADVAGDGRTAVPVSVSGAPAGGGKPLPVTEVPVVTCTGAAGLAALGNTALAAVLVPAVTAPTTLECTARLRESTTTFQLQLRVPGAGLYASTNQIAKTTDGEAKLSAFVWDGKRRAVPSWLHAAASDGTVAIGKGGVLTLGLSGKAPRTVAVAMIDGARVGAAFVPVTGSTVLPVESEVGSTVQVWVAGTWYGPIPTKGKLAEVPIDVPAGVTHGIARSTDKKGYVSDVVVDLKIPALPRIAVSAPAPSIGAGETVTLAVAIAGPDARPAPVTSKLVVAAERGTVAAAKSAGGGLWTLRYTAPATQGADRITVNVDGDARAGSGELTLDVRGIAAKIVLDVPPAFEPGSDLTGSVRVLDENGTVLREPDLGATLGGEPVEVVGGDVMQLHGKIPEKVPASGTLPLEVTSGNARIRADLFIGGSPSTARVRTKSTDRAIRAELRVLDRFGNLVPESTFEVIVTGGKLDSVRRDGDAYIASITAGESDSTAHVIVRAKGKTLADAKVRLDPIGTIGLGAWLHGGYIDNLGAWSSPRAGVGAALKRRFAAFEAGLSVGVEGVSASDTLAVDVGRVMQDATRSIAAIGIPLGLRARFPVGERFGVAAGAAFVTWRVRVKFAPDSQMADAYNETVLGVRGTLSGDATVGPGRVVVAASYGRARLADGAVVGQIEGFGVTLGYEWWFGALSR